MINESTGDQALQLHVNRACISGSVRAQDVRRASKVYMHTGADPCTRGHVKKHFYIFTDRKLFECEMFKLVRVGG